MTAFVLYRPVLDYEESEQSQLVFSTMDKALAARGVLLEWLHRVQARYEGVQARYEADELDLDADAVWETKEEIEAEECWAPFGWCFDSADTGRYGCPSGDTCVSIRELPLDPEPQPSAP